MPHHYRITVEPLKAEAPAAPLTFEVTNHDDLLAIVGKIASRDDIPHAEAAEFAIGLKLTGEVLIRHRKAPLFAPLFATFGEFMRRLKGQ